MFDSPRGLTLVPTRLRTAVLLSVAAHLSLLALALLLGRPVPIAPPTWTSVRLPKGLGAAGGAQAGPISAPPSQGRPSAPPRPRRPERPPRPEARTPEYRPPAAVDAPPAVSTDPASIEAAGAPGDGPGQGPGPGTCIGGPCQGGGGPGAEILSESIVAALPELVSGPTVRLPASAQGLTGTMQVRCVITVSGTVADCEILKGAPLAEAAVLAALRARTYRPAQLDGRPVAVRHHFNIPLGPPR